jgi:hypothetical protein
MRLNIFSNCMTIQNYFIFFNNFKVMQTTRKSNNDNDSLYHKFLNFIFFFKKIQGDTNAPSLHSSRDAHGTNHLAGKSWYIVDTLF